MRLTAVVIAVVEVMRGLIVEVMVVKVIGAGL